jgi:hypothetical protein
MWLVKVKDCELEKKPILFINASYANTFYFGFLDTDFIIFMILVKVFAEDDVIVTIMVGSLPVWVTCSLGNGICI